MRGPLLSILIPTTPDRWDMFDKLYYELNRQVTYMDEVHNTLGKIEILYDDSKRFLDGGLSIGKKREALVMRATGMYLCFVDSDDFVSPNYIEAIVRLCHAKPDIVTFRNVSKFDNYWCIVDMSLRNKRDEEATPDKIVLRRPWHTCPVKRDYAQLYKFPDTNYGEDASWMNSVLLHCKIESHTEALLHLYNHSSKHSEADKITNYGKAEV